MASKIMSEKEQDAWNKKCWNDICKYQDFMESKGIPLGVDRMVFNIYATDKEQEEMKNKEVECRKEYEQNKK